MMPFHPLANVFPTIAGEDYAALVEDIRRHGLREPIWTYQGAILDGRNRYRACLEAGVTPKFRAWKGQSGRLVDFVTSMNLARRHLTSSQRAAIATEIEEYLAQEAKERKEATYPQEGQKGFQSNVPQKIAEHSPKKQRDNESRQHAAKKLKTNRQYVSEAKKLKQQNREAFEQVRNGTKTLPQAKREQKRRVREAQWAAEVHTDDAVRSLQDLLASGQRFRTIYADPPWKYSNQATRAATRNHYPTMTPEEIAALPIAQLAADEAHLHLWTTTAFLFECQAILTAWGFTYKSMLVWVKPQLGIGNYWRVSHEILVLGVRGSLSFRVHGHPSWIEADRTAHSEKPEVIRQLIEQVSPPPYLELFGRQMTPGWTVWGNQIEHALLGRVVI